MRQIYAPSPSPTIWNPESTYNTFPVTPRPILLERKTAASATSAGSVFRRKGAIAATPSSTFEKSLMPRAEVVFYRSG